MNSRKIILFILSILLAIPPFFSGGNNVFIRGMIFVLAGLAGLLLRKEARKSSNPLCQGGVKVIYNPLFYLFLYLSVDLIAVFFSASIYQSAVLWLLNLAYATLFFIAAKSTLGKRQIDILIKTFLAVSGLLCLIGIYFYVVGSYSRLTSLFWWPNPFAGYLLFSLFLGIDWLLNCHFDPVSAGEKSLRGYISTFKGFLATLGMTIPFLFLSIIFSSFILTGSRGAFLSFLIVLPIYFWLKFLKSPYAPFIKGVDLKSSQPSIFAREKTPSPCEGEGWGEVSAQVAITTPPPLRPFASIWRGIVGAPLIKRIRGFIRILAVIFLSIFLVFIINSIKNDSFSFLSHIKTSGTEQDFSSGIRLKYWQGAREMFKDRPLTGWGAGTFGTVYRLYQKDAISAGKYAHNLYLETLAEQGIFTTIFFILFLALVLFGAGCERLANRPLSLLRRGGGEVSWGAAKQGYAYQSADATPRQTSPNPSLVRRGILKSPYAPFIKGGILGGNASLALFCALIAFLIHNGVDVDWHFSANTIVFWIFSGLLYNVSRGNSNNLGEELGLPHSCHCERSEAIPARRANRDCFVVRGGLLAMTILLILSGIVLLRGNYFYEQGIKFKEANNLAKDEQAFQKSIFLNPNPDYLKELGIILYSKALNANNAEQKILLNKALEISQKIIKHDSYNSLNHELGGRIYLAQGNLSEAEKNFKEAIRLDKFNPMHYINLVSLLINEGKKDEARDLINKILSFYPEEVVANRKAYIMANQEITSGIEKEIEYLKYLLNMISR